MQINHAGDGGLYPEMIRDRSFEAMAAFPAATASALQNATHAAHITSLGSSYQAKKASAKSLQGYVTCSTGLDGLLGM